MFLVDATTLQKDLYESTYGNTPDNSFNGKYLSIHLVLPNARNVLDFKLFCRLYIQILLLTHC